MRIRDIATIASCTLPEQDTVWLLNLDAVEQQTGKVIEYKYISPDSLTGSTTAFDTNTVLYSKLRPNLNKVVVPTMSGYATSEMLPLRPDPQICTREYLACYLRSNAFVEWAVSKTNGAKMPRLGTKDLLDKEIPVPSIQTQEYIVAVFACVESLIDDLSQMLSHFDDLVKSRFIEMFGDLANPACSWPKAKLAEACVDPDDIKCGPFGTQLSKDEYRHEGIALWEIPQINSQFGIEPTHYLDSDKASELEAYSIIPGDIAMSRKGNVGRCAVFPCDFAPGIIHSDVLRIRVDSEKVVPIFMMYQLHYSGAVKRQIEQVSSGAIMAGINVTKLKSITVHLPPMDQQKQFEVFVTQTDKSKYSFELEVAA